MKEPVRVYTPATLAKRWLCSDQHIRNMIERGELKAFRVGGKLVRITAEEAEDYERRNASP